jgi:metal-responsive CopG/Arc/MetJ family transcriptional regulator
MVDKIDSWAIREKMPSRSEAIRVLIDAGLDQKEAEKQ